MFELFSLLLVVLLVVAVLSVLYGTLELCKNVLPISVATVEDASLIEIGGRNASALYYLVILRMHDDDSGRLRQFRYHFISSEKGKVLSNQKYQRLESHFNKGGEVRVHYFPIGGRKLVFPVSPIKKLDVMAGLFLGVGVILIVAFGYMAGG